MSKIKILFLSFVLGLVVSVTPTFAQTTTTAPTAPVAIAHVNIGSAKIINQVENNFNISFNISNGQGLQTNVKYGIRLLKKEGKTTTLVDEKTYDESFTLPENSNVTKGLVYTAPESLSGTYLLFVTSSNNKGFPFGIVSLGEVKLTAAKNAIEIIPDSCTTVTSSVKEPKKISEVVDLFTDEAMKISCSVANKSSVAVSVSPVFETRDRSSYGDIITTAVEKFNAPVSLKPQEKKTILVVVPQVKEIGLYNVSLAFTSGEIKSNSVSSMYRVGGGSPSIINVSPDADYYAKGENANVVLIWSGQNVSSADVSITKKFDRVCGAINTTLESGKNTIVVPIKKDCFNPTIKVSLKGADGSVLAQQTVNIATTSRTEDKGIFSGVTGTVLIIAILLLLAGLGIYLKRKGLHKTGTIVSILVIGLSIALVPFSKASANTYPAGPSQNLFVTVNLSHDLNSPNQVQDVYTPGETIVIDGFIHSDDDATNTVYLSAITVGTAAPVYLFDDPRILLPNATTFGDTQILIAPPCAPGQSTCSYDMSFNTQVFQSGGGLPCNVVGQMSFQSVGGTGRRGRVVYAGPATHPAYTVNVDLYGYATPPGTALTTITGTAQFTIPANSSNSFYNGLDCTASPSGCEIAGTSGFDHGEIQVPASCSSCQAYVRFVGTFRFGGVIWLGPAQHPAVTAQVAIVGNMANGITTNEPYDTFAFTIPANASQSVMGEFYAVSGFDHGWVASTSLPWACGDQNQNYTTCFIADTQVDLADGTKKNIQDVKIGDVLKGETSNNTVLGFHRPTLDGKIYSFNGGRFFVTEEHPFKTIDGWKSINPKKTATENIGITVTDLKVGDTLVTDHGLEKILTIDSKNEPANTPLYNFKLDGDHTYYADGYLVHNKQECDVNNACYNNKTCINPDTGYRITSPSQAGTCPIGCRYPGQPNRPFCSGYAPYTSSQYCPTPAGACTN